MKPTTSTTARNTRSKAKAQAGAVPATDASAEAQPPTPASLPPSRGGRNPRPTTAPPSAAPATKSNSKPAASADNTKAAGLGNAGSCDDLSDLSDLSDSDNEATESPKSAPRGGGRGVNKAVMPPLPVPTRPLARKRPSTAAPTAPVTPLPSEPHRANVAAQLAVQDSTAIISSTDTIEEDMDVTSSVDSSVLLDVDDSSAPQAAAASPVVGDPAPAITEPKIASEVPDEPPTAAARRGTRATRSAAKPKDTSSSSSADVPAPAGPSTRATRSTKKATAAGNMDIDQPAVDPSSSRLSSDTPAPPPKKKLKAKSHGPGRLPTITSTQSTPIPLANLKKLTPKKRVPQIRSLLEHSDPEWIATARDSPIALLDSLDWIVNQDAWRALPPATRHRLLRLVPACDKTSDGLDLTPGFWSSPAVVHQAVVYPDYVRAEMVIPILADSVSVEAAAAAEPHVDADGDATMPDAAAAAAQLLPKPISELRIMKTLTGDLDPRTLPASDTDRAFLLALVGDDAADEDAWKDENFERFWGDLDESLMRANRSRAGESSTVTLKHLFAAGMLRVGDVISYRRRWMSPTPVAVEVDLKVTKFQASSGFCTTVVLRDSYKHLSDATPRAMPTTKMGLPSKADEELVWKTPNQVEATIWAAVAPGHKRPNGNAWRDMRRVREDEDEDEEGVPLFKLRHDYLDEHEA